MPTVVNRSGTNSLFDWPKAAIAKSESETYPAGKTLPWWEALALGALATWLYYPVGARLVSQWFQDPNFSHGVFVPFFSLFVVWRDRARLLALPQKPSWCGAGLAGLAMAMLVVGILGAELFLARTSLLVLIAGLIVLFLGWTHMRALLFPWAFLFLMVPIPALVFNQVTLPLQSLASRVAAAALPLAGVPVLREGNVIHLPAMPLEVAEACSGIRSLLSLVTLAVIYSYLRETRRWIQVVLVAASIPIAITANSARIVGTGLLVQYWDPDKAEGFFHAFSDWLIFLFSVGLLMFSHVLLRRFRRQEAP